MTAERTVAVVARDGVTLEARLAVPARARAGVVICHPHPLYGGDMDNPVVVRVAEVCRAAGVGTLRFNFRGVGGSSGSHGGGDAEQDDVRAAMEELATALGPAGTVALAGYSFGAAVAAAVATDDPRVWGLALVALPLGRPDATPPTHLRAARGPLLLVSGGRDPYAPREALERLGQELPHAVVRVIPDADHFFLGRLFPLGEAIAAWAAALEAGQPGRGGGPG